MLLRLRRSRKELPQLAEEDVYARSYGERRRYGLRTVPATPVFRAATPADAEPIARLVIDGFETYRSFSPPGWEPPPLDRELGHLEVLLPDDDVWVWLAEEGGRLVGQVTILPSMKSVHPEREASLAHFRNLFIAREFLGRMRASVA